MTRLAAFLVALLLQACGTSSSDTDAALPDSAVDSRVDVGPQDATFDEGPADSGLDAGLDGGDRDADPCAPPLRLRVVTFNTGTTDSEADRDHPDGYGDDQAQISDTYYGNGLSWLPAVEAATAWMLDNRPDIIVFQELFHSALCVDVPADARAGFVCEEWSEGDASVVNRILGPDYQVACNLGKPDKCAAVRRDVGSFRGCDADLCLDGLDGARVEDCGGGSRIGRGVVELACGGTVTVVNVHGTSGVSGDDQDCREQQFNQVFEDLLDGSGPAANGERNLIMGDFNTDPGRATRIDDSADRLERLIDARPQFHFISEKGSDAPRSYAGLFDIDHVISDAFDGSCDFAGHESGPPVYEHDYFDHFPLVCEIELSE